MEAIFRAVPEAPAPRLDTGKVPRHIKTTLAQALFDAINADFQRPEVRADYERWKAERAKYQEGAKHA